MSDPPFQDHYGHFFAKDVSNIQTTTSIIDEPEELELPLIDMDCLRSRSLDERSTCASAMARAAEEWGFFQVVNHGIGDELILEMKREQRRVFEKPFENKSCCGLFNGSYRWGTPTANSLGQFSWSEAFHVPVSLILEENDHDLCDTDSEPLRDVMKRFTAAMSELAHSIATILAQNLGSTSRFFADSCSPTTCFLRLNRYPPCQLSSGVFGLTPHTDSDFLTILCQDEVGGLQLMKDSAMIAVKPNPRALIVNIGDLLQAWSNDVYKSVEHMVMTNATVERHSIAYFMCPSYDSVVSSCLEHSAYRNFTFGEYRRQVQEDVKTTGQKIGLPRFRI